MKKKAPILGITALCSNFDSGFWLCMLRWTSRLVCLVWSGVSSLCADLWLVGSVGIPGV